MSMVTSCPSCTTTFRVTADQLKHRHGKVRCGSCSGVFDAFKTLAPLADEPLAQIAEAGGDDAGIIRHQGASPQASLDIDPEPRIDAALDAADSAQDASARRARRARILWSITSVVLCAGLALQLAYAFRDTLGAAVPASRPLLQSLCAVSGCTLSLPRRTDLLAIEASDLQADPARANVIVLTAALRNRGNVVVAYPALELTLTSTNDQAIARRIFLPGEYLPRPAEAQAGMGALAAVDIRLELDTADLRPSGYRLFLFYP